MLVLLRGVIASPVGCLFCFVLFAGTLRRGAWFPLGCGRDGLCVGGVGPVGGMRVGVAGEIGVLGRSQLTLFSPFQHASRLPRFILLRKSSDTLLVVSIVVSDCHL